MKRFILFVVILSLVLTACGGGGKSASNEATSGPVNITFWHSETASNSDNLVKLVDRFNASQNEVKVEPIYQGIDQDLTLKLIAGMPSGNVPAVAYMSEPFTRPMIDSGEIVPIQQYIDRDKYDLSDFAPAAIAYYTVDDTLYAMLWGGKTPSVSGTLTGRIAARVLLGQASNQILDLSGRVRARPGAPAPLAPPGPVTPP